MPSGYTSYFTTNTDKDKEIVDLYVNSKLTGRRIAEAYKVSKKIIYNVLKRNGVVMEKAYTQRCGYKTCTKCNKDKAVADFGKNKGIVKSWCKECRRLEKRHIETSTKWKIENRDKLRAQWRRKGRKEKLDPVKYLHSKIRTSIHDCIEAKKHKNGKTFEILGYTPYDLKAHLENLFVDGMGWHNKGLWHVDHKRPLASFEFKSKDDIKTAWALDNLQPLWATDNISKSSFYRGIKHSYKTTQL